MPVFYFFHQYMSGDSLVYLATSPTYFYTPALIVLHHNRVNTFIWEFKQLHRRSVRMPMSNLQ